jgi:signal transduction histidine kinase
VARSKRAISHERARPHAAEALLALDVRRETRVERAGRVGTPFSSVDVVDARSTSLEELLESVLRGAAKILGCSSANLILIDDRTGEIRVRLGAMASSYPMLAELERLLGDSFKGITFPMSRARDSLVVRCWQERSILETSSLYELVGSALPLPALAQMDTIIGTHRFAVVPASSDSRSYGVILLEKEGPQPFSRQQCEVLLRYARRIGQIVEDDMTGRGHRLISGSGRDRRKYLLLARDGRELGCSHGLDASLRAGLVPPGRREVSEALAIDERPSDAAARRGSALLRGGGGVELTSFDLADESCVLCELTGESDGSDETLETQLLHLTLGAPAPALFVDPDFVVTSGNAACERLFQETTSALQGRHLASLFSDPQQILEVLGQQLLDPSRPYCEESTIVVRRDGTLVPVRVEALVLADDVHRLVGILLVLRSDACEGSESLDRLLRNERLATMGEMAAQLAHEIRNPLVAIGATIDGLIREPLEAEEQRSALRSIAREIERLDMTLKDYLATARQEIVLEPVSVLDVVRRSKRLLEGGRRFAHATVSVDIESDLVIRADGDAMKQLFFNLLLNALEASPRNGVVRCSAAASERDVSIHVDDSGSGLPAPAEECFQPFFTTKKNGSGLGLSVCQHIARVHGGLLRLTNRTEGGCRATVMLPRAER